MSESFGLSTIGQIALPVRDVATSVRFYRDTLGLPLLFEFPGLAFFNCGGVRLMLEAAQPDTEHRTSSVIYYKVDGIQAAFKTLQERGVAFEDEPHIIAEMEDHTLWMTFFRDPDAHLLALMCEMPKG